jgi:hypothetical protein
MKIKLAASIAGPEIEGIIVLIRSACYKQYTDLKIIIIKVASSSLMNIITVID